MNVMNPHALVCPARRAQLLIVVLLLMIWKTTVAHAAPDAAEIVRQADAIRFPAEGFQVDILVNTVSADGKADEPRQYRVLSKGNDRTLVMTLAPAFEKGQLLLMRDDDLWVFLPKVTQPVRLPLSQKLTGQVANGDLARANFAGDYTAELIREEALGDSQAYVLALTAARKGVTYARVTYWVEKGSHRPLRAEFYTGAGRLLKTAEYRGYGELGGAVRPTELVLEDQVGLKQRSVMQYARMKFRDLDAKIFTKQYLKKLN